MSTQSAASRPWLHVGAQDGKGHEKLQIVEDSAALGHIRPANAALNIVMVFGAARQVSEVQLCLEHPKHGD
jgi:hypothetical protein